MDLKTASEDIQIAKMIIAQWVRKYNIGELEYNLVIDKLDAASKAMGGCEGRGPADNEVETSPDIFSLSAGGFDDDSYFNAEEDERIVILDHKELEEAAREIDKEPVSEEEALPTMSEIEREIIMHETGEAPDDVFETITGKQRSDREALKSLYYEEDAEKTDENPAPAVEKAGEDSIASTIGRMAHEINETETFRDTYAEELLHKEYDNKPVLGEVINAGVHVIGDSFAPANIVTGITGKTGLKKAIGLNDKYLLIRDLFHGDSELYEESVNQLDDFTDLNDAMIYIHDNFHWDSDSEAAKLIVELLVNKLA